MNVLATAKAGLTSMEHWYGLPESLFADRTVQNYPANYNYSNEQESLYPKPVIFGNRPPNPARPSGMP